MSRVVFVAFFALFAVFLISCKRAESPPGHLSEPVEAAFRFLADEYGVVAPDSKLSLLDQRVDRQGALHLRFQQVYDSIPVYASNVIVHLNPDLTGRLLTGNLVGMPSNINTEAELDPGSAREAAREQPCAEVTDEPDLVYWLDSHNEPVLTWRVPGKRGLLACDVFVDADEPRILGTINRSPSGK